jgi:hypothetical protein
VYGRLGPDWRSSRAGALVAGPIAWVALGSVRPGQASSLYAPSRGLAPFVKGLAVVDPGQPVKVSVPAREQNRLSLDYTHIEPRSERPQTDQQLLRVSDGASTVTFKPCPRDAWPDGRTQFAGGFIVSGAQCAELDIQTVGSANRLRRYLAFGTQTRTCGGKSVHS